MKDANPWTGASARLKQLYEARVPAGLTQKAFGLKYGIGSQSMVAQYLTGRCPLNYDAAAKFAKGLGCTIYDISPEMAESLKHEILPFLGKAMRRAAMYAALAVLPALMYAPESHAFSRSIGPATVYYVKRRFDSVTGIFVRFLTWLVACGGLRKTVVS